MKIEFSREIFLVKFFSFSLKNCLYKLLSQKRQVNDKTINKLFLHFHETCDDVIIGNL